MTADPADSASEPGTAERPIRISGSLYDELRAHCDRYGIRFVRFVEEALEKATYIDEIEALLKDGGTMLAKLEAERRRGVAHGFAMGVLAATLSMDGNLEAGRLMTPEAALPSVPSRPVTGSQLKLFD